MIMPKVIKNAPKSEDMMGTIPNKKAATDNPCFFILLKARINP